MAEATKPVNNVDTSNPSPLTATFSKPLSGISKIEVCRHNLLSALSNDLFDVYCSYTESKEICDSLILKYTIEDVLRQRFIIANYYRWIMNEEKDIKVQINEYHKLLEDLKTEKKDCGGML
ncbi:hypothetical protein JHK85_000982 [Glycine max]|uniref:Uncharacterized protein n=1 Tax=Glycine max TaxID=3847 RepID=A0A0R0L833_SOYBN|nr:hypothetical protein JHK85_000982 [Glycine max]KAG5088338.1 hypothetical protein JHK86_000950 [Glycine max]KAH1162218.1 hypothetical protein GYH30_000915 [Glycine max]